MSLVPRLMLAIVSGLFGLMMIGIAPPTDKAPFFYAFGSFCIAISLACITRGRIAQFFGCSVGIAIIGLAIWYITSTITTGKLASGQSGQPSILNAIFFTLAFGLPAARYVWKVRFGFGPHAGESIDEPLSELMAIEFDDAEVRIRVLKRLKEDWNQTFQWNDIRRVCFKDAGMYRSDMIIIELKSRDKPVVALTEGRGGSSLFGALVEKGYFPDHVWREAIGDTHGGLHCWPPKNDVA